MPELKDAIAAIKAGDKATGQQILLAILKTDPRNETALLWLAATTNDPARQRQVFERVLAINPDNKAARQGLAKLEEASKPAQSAPLPLPEPLAAPPQPASPEPPPPPTKLRSLSKPIETTKKCPYCAETIKAAATVCRFCGRDLTTGQVSGKPEPTKPAQNSLPVKKSKTSPLLVTVLILVAIGGLCVMMSIVSVLNSSTRRSSTPKPAQQPSTGGGDYQLELLSSSLTQSSESYLRTEGEVKNISGESLDAVLVVVQLYDANDNFITSDSAVIEYNPILPGQTSPFTVLTRNNPAIERYRVSFKFIFGGTISTKDSRP